MMVKTDMTAKEIINDFKENYAKVRKLLDEDALNDPDNEPYLSKYKAKDILIKMHEDLIITKNSNADLDGVKIDAMLGIILLNIGIIDMETDDGPACEKALTEAEALLLPHSSKPEVIATLIKIENQLGLLWSNRDVSEKVKTHLFKAKEFYETFKSTMQMPVPIEHSHASEDVTGDIMLLEEPYTLTLYYLAQVYASLKEELKSSIYFHVTLRRQLQYNVYDPIDWSLNSATLSQYFAERHGFFQSRYHLAAASTILDQYETKLLADETNDEVMLSKKEQFNHRSADVARCWVKYCINLMRASKTRLMDGPENLNGAITDLSDLELEDNENICGGDVRNLVFPDLDVSKYEKKISDKFLLTYQDAREVFLNCQDWLNKAKEYYTSDTLASDYIQLVQDTSEAYSLLTFFEEDDERQAKMHKRRIDIIEKLLIIVNPTYYLHYCQQLWYELGTAYTQILDIKLDKVKNGASKITPHLLKKINMLCEKSIENYELFIDSFKENGVLPTHLEEDQLRGVICAYGFVAQNSRKRIALDKPTQLIHAKKSLASHLAVVDICMKDSNIAKILSVEYSLCQEMAKMLPTKIKRLERDLAAQSSTQTS